MGPVVSVVILVLKMDSKYYKGHKSLNVSKFLPILNYLLD